MRLQQCIMMNSSSDYRGKEALRQNHELSSLQRKKSTNATLATTLKPPRRCSSRTSSSHIIIGDAQEIANSSLRAPIRSSSPATYNKCKKKTADNFFTERSPTHHRQRYKNQSNLLNNNINNHHFSVQKKSSQRQRHQGRSRNNNSRRKRRGSSNTQY